MTEREAAQASKLVRPLRDDLKRLLRELVQTNSVAAPPGGSETPAQRILQRFLRRHGVKSELYDTAFIQDSGSPLVRRNRTYRGRKNLNAHIAGSRRGKSLLLNGHMDTVPPGRAPWPRSPWSGHWQAGRIHGPGSRLHGLGSFDMKGGIVANAAVLCALTRAGIRPGGDIRFESVVDEEWGGGGGTIAARLRDDTQFGRPDACVIPEGTQLQLYRATRGGFVVDLVVDAGDPSGYFSRSEVVGPALATGRLLAWVDSQGKRRAQLPSRGAYAEFPDPAPVQVLAIESGGLDVDMPLSVPSQATVRVYFQFLPEEDVDAVIVELHRELEEFCACDPFFRSFPVSWSPCSLTGGPLYGQEVALDHPWTRCLAESAASVLPKPPSITAAPYPCDAGLMHREFGIPTLLFGPCGAGAHNAGEYVEFDSVLRTAEVLLAAALEWTA